MNGFKRFVHEVHRRSLWQVLGIYVVGGWVVLQAVDTLAGALNLPDWASPLALFLLIVGLPMVLATAFVQEGIRGGSDDDAPGHSATADSAAASGDAWEEASHAAASGALPGPSPSGAQKLFTWRNAVSGGVLAFALWGVVATAVLLSGSRSIGSPSSAARSADALRSIAVLPFENLSPDAENAYFADGIHEDVLTQLSKLGDLTVISRTSVLPYRDTDKSLSDIADELGVGSILEGSVRRAGDNVRITAQLIDASTDEHLWADNFDRGLSTANVFAIQSEIAQRIAEALAATLTPEAEQQITRSPTADLDAYDFYLQARSTYQLYTESGNDEAIRLYKEALSRDPGYADAWAGLADAYAQRTQRYGFGLEWGDSAMAAAQRALQIEPDLPKGYKALALAYSALGRFEDDLNANLRAVELDPNYSEAINNLALPLANQGRYDEALAYMKRAFQLEPTTGFSSSNIALAYNLLGMTEAAEARALEILRLQPSNQEAVVVLRGVDQARGDFGGAVARSQSLVDLEPGVSRHWIGLATDAYLAGDFELALSAAEEALRLTPNTQGGGLNHIRVIRGVSLLRTGDRQAGIEALESIKSYLVERRAVAPELSNVPYDIATVDAALGDDDAAMQSLEEAYSRGYRTLGALDWNPAFENLRDDPRFQALANRIREDIAVQRANVQRQEAAEGRP